MSSRFSAGGSPLSSGDRPHRNSLPSGPEPHAGRIDGQRRAMQRVRRLAAVDDVDVALARLDRQPQARQRGQLARPGAGRIDQRAAGDAAAARQPYRLDAGARFDAGDVVMQDRDAALLRRFAEQRGEARRIEPALARSAEAAGGHAVRREPGEQPCQPLRRRATRCRRPWTAAGRRSRRAAPASPASPGSDSPARGRRRRRRRRTSISASRNTDSVNCDMAMFSGVENCCRMPPAERAGAGLA